VVSGAVISAVVVSVVDGGETAVGTVEEVVGLLRVPNARYRTKARAKIRRIVTVRVVNLNSTIP